MLTRYVERDLTWIDLASPTPEEVRSLMKQYDLDPLIAEELLNRSFRPKVERRGEHVYVILHFPSLRVSGERPEQEIDFVLGKNFLITARYDAIDPLHTFARAFEVNAVLGRGHARHGGHLFVGMVRDIYQSLSYECDGIRRRLQDIEDRIFKGDERDMVVQLSMVGRLIHDFRQGLLPHQEMLGSLEPAASRLFGPEFVHYVRELEGAHERLGHALENLRDSLGELRATNDSLLNAKQNEIMKTLTVLAFVFLPLSFIAGLFGMNTINNPIIGNAHDFWIIFAGMCIIAAGCFIYFKRKRWL